MVRPEAVALKVVCLLSGGIDSPVAAYLMGRNGAEVILLHMDNRPYADNAVIEKVQRLADQLGSKLGRPCSCMWRRMATISS